MTEPNPIPEKEVRAEKIRRVKEMAGIFNEIRKEIDGNSVKMSDLARETIFDSWVDAGLLDVVKVKEIIKEPYQYLTSPEKRLYEEQRRWKLKEIEKTKAEEEKKRQRIELALQRKQGYCLKCRKNVILTDLSHEIKQKRHSAKESITIRGKCPECQMVIGFFGGYTS